METKTKNGSNEEQMPLNQVEAIVLGHEVLENGTRLIIVTENLDFIPRKLKLVW